MFVFDPNRPPGIDLTLKELLTRDEDADVKKPKLKSTDVSRHETLRRSSD